MLTHTASPPEAPSRVVAVGAGGFIGRQLLADLEAEGVPALGTYSADLDLGAEGAAEKLAGQLRESDQLVMLAALTPDKGRDLATFMKNLKMAESVCQALKQQPVRQVVYISSDAVYPFGDQPVDETSCAAPGDLYGTMHKAREVMFQDALGADTPLAILRPTLVFGAADSHNSYGPNRFRRLIAKDGAVTLGGGGEETRDHIAVEDVSALIRLVLRHRSAGVLNLVTGQSISFDALARKVAALFQPAGEVRHSERRAPATHRHFDNRALQKAFPEFRFTPLDEGLAGAHAAMLAQQS